VYYQWRRLNEAGREARSREIAAEARAQMDEDPRLGLLLALEAANISPTEQARDALRDTLSKFYLRRILIGHDGPVRDVSYSPDGKFIVTAGWDNTVRVWNAQTGESVKVLKEHTNHVLGVKYSRDGRYIVSGSADKTVRVWDTATWEVTTLRSTNLRAGVYHVDISSDSRFIAAASDSQVIIFDWLNDKAGANPLILKLTRPMRAFCVEFSPDGQYLVTSGAESVARIWNLKTEDGKPKLEETLEGHTGIVRNAAFSSDGNLIVTVSEGGLKAGKSTGTAVDNKNQNQNTGTGAHDVQSSKPEDTDEDWTARVWQWRSNAYLLSFPDHTGPLYDGAFSPDGHFVISASRDKTARVWDAKDGRVSVVLVSHEKPLYAATFSPPDGRFVVTVSEDGTARIWQVINDPIPEDTPMDELKKRAREQVRNLNLALKPQEKP
ncbi:MAG: WD40 repeat domain-containing protein, partial [Acidobacteria bacterium]|nr:WD40 repeat domain-containing protein [Acidobacteriota bacterium]